MLYSPIPLPEPPGNERRGEGDLCSGTKVVVEAQGLMQAMEWREGEWKGEALGVGLGEEKGTGMWLGRGIGEFPECHTIVPCNCNEGAEAVQSSGGVTSRPIPPFSVSLTGWLLGGIPISS